MPTEPSRPDPAELLTRAKREEAQARRGRLKIFFGAAPGVGKTYAMLAAANRLAREGVDVVVGLVETHGRSETEQMLLGLDLLPRRTVDYRGVTLQEFDLDAALARKPEILLVDELAHTNAPGGGGRFEKRWQDIEELLRSGISVFTTLNVQHIESLNDVIAQITGVQVRETVPDAVVERADEIELVDLPPEALLERLHSGKVYVPETVQHAIESFFRVGNLTALRELSLRRTAEWVDAQMREQKSGAGETGRRARWHAAERIMVCVSPSPMSPRIVRAAKRLAAGLHAQLIAAFVETPAASRMAAVDRERLVQTLRLAESLGAETITLSGSDAAAELVSFARSRNVSKIVVGKTGLSRWRERWSGSFVNDVMRQSGEIDVYVIRGDADDLVNGAERSPPPLPTIHSSWREYILAALIVVACTVMGVATNTMLEATNIVMLYLLGVVVAATRLGRGPAVCVAILGVAAFDYFFVPPQLTFAVSDVQYLLTFGVMLVVGLLIATLTNRLRDLASTAQQRERRTSALYAMSRELASSRDQQDVASVAVRHMHDTFDADVVLLNPRRGDQARTLEVLATHGSPDWIDERERGVAQWSFDHAKVAGAGTSALPSVAGRHIPLLTPGGTQGVLALRPHMPQEPLTPQQILLLETFANQIALALERVTLLEGQQTARVEAEAERLRSALLSSVSHDLRTPLATITGATTSLLESGAAMDEATRHSLLQGIDSEAQRLNELISNLVFATRLDSGAVQLRRDWTTVEEIIGAGLSRLRDRLQSRPFRVLIPNDLPLLRVDGALLPQVIHNLVENALRHTPDGTPIEITAWATDQNIIVRVADEGPGFPVGDEERAFERFYRGAGSTIGSGMGLGLTICRGIVRAHDGRIWTENNSTASGARAPGASVVFSLPIERPQPRLFVEEPVLRDPAAGPGGIH